MAKRTNYVRTKLAARITTSRNPSQKPLIDRINAGFPERAAEAERVLAATPNLKAMYESFKDKGDRNG